MATYPLMLKPSFSYADHLMYNQYIGDVNTGIQRAASDIVKGQTLSAQVISETMNRNASHLADTISSGVGQLSDDIYDLSRTVEYGLEQVSAGIEGLRADFDIAMGQVISQFEMMREEMRAGFNRMIDILENRRKTEAQEHFRDALEFYRDGCRFSDKPQWFGDSLKHLLASVEGYERNPVAHLHVGHIYHYQREHEDFEKALEHYALCYTYGEADEKDHAVAAQGYFYGGWLKAAVFDELEEAIKLTQKALKLDPKLAEAHYHLAKFHGVRGEAEPAVQHLERAIVDFDRNYCIKAGGDPDLDPVRRKVNELFERMREEARERLEEMLEPMDRDFDTMNAVWRDKLTRAWNDIVLTQKEESYFGYLDGLYLALELVKMEAAARKADQRRSKDVWRESIIGLLKALEKRELETAA